MLYSRFIICCYGYCLYVCFLLELNGDRDYGRVKLFFLLLFIIVIVGNRGERFSSKNKILVSYFSIRCI